MATPDLILANSATNVLLGNGDGTFQNQMFFSDGATPGFFAVADLNGDGIPDIASAYQFNALVGVQLGNGNGAFQMPVFYQMGALGGSVVVGDFNGDGKPDLVAAQTRAGSSRSRWAMATEPSKLRQPIPRVAATTRFTWRLETSMETAI